MCSLQVLAAAAKTNIKVLIALQDIARGSHHCDFTSQKTPTLEGIKITYMFVSLKCLRSLLYRLCGWQ